MKPDSTMDKYFYRTGLVLIGMMVLYAVISRVVQFHLIEVMPLCAFHTLTGFYCPGCGGTRATYALLSGHPLISLYLHPFVVYVAIVGGWFMVSQTMERLSGGKLRIGMHYRNIYLWIALIIIIVNFLVKNAILYFTGIALLG